MPEDAACVFCRIARGESPAHVVHADDDVVAFLNTSPAAAGHTLLIPRAHYPTVYETPPAVVARSAEILPRLAAAVRDAVGAHGAMVLMNAGPPGQLVFHVHWHVIPRSHGDEFGRRTRGLRAGDANPAATAEAIRRSL